MQDNSIYPYEGGVSEKPLQDICHGNERPAMSDVSKSNIQIKEKEEKKTRKSCSPKAFEEPAKKCGGILDPGL